MNWILILSIIIILTFAIATLLVSYISIRFGWYEKLSKPEYYYNEWIYSPLWFIFYGVLIYALVRSFQISWLSFGLLLVHLILLFLFIYYFFYSKDPYSSIYYITFAIIILIVSIFFVLDDPILVGLLLVYLLWLTYLYHISSSLLIANPQL
jgi:tryptophan-rich sensory protein